MPGSHQRLGLEGLKTVASRELLVQGLLANSGGRVRRSVSARLALDHTFDPGEWARNLIETPDG
jgi:hypothetical protein